MSAQTDEAKYPVCWKEQLIGSISELGQPDMWYFDAKWNPEDSPLAQEFAQAIAHLVGKVFWSLEIEQLTWVEIPSLKLNCTVVHIPIDDRITFRRMFKIEPPKN
ncbi:MAG TPA: hypothetical protein VHD90_10460 [Phototrophicaceae bacterium]|nr:hypothetical protein [Phototrophicaceae bacterium]